MPSLALLVAALIPFGSATDTATVATADSAARATVPIESASVGPVAHPVALALQRADTVTRPKAIHYSDAYEMRSTIHRIGSYAIVPLFAAQYVLGQKLMDDPSSSTRNMHSLVAGGVGVLFGVNTITGAWNWWEGRNDPSSRTKRTLHALTMVLADAGFVATGATAEGGSRNTHRALALGSMGLSVGSAAMMWFWKD